MRILVYGDSNSWGYLADGSGVRHTDRWPVRMARALDAVLIEDCLPGRTTRHDDPTNAQAEPTGIAWNGLAHIEAAMLAASPLTHVLIMLGTNDMKTRFAPTSAKVADSLALLARRAAGIPAGPGVWDDTDPPRIGVICPPPLGPVAADPAWEEAAEWRGGHRASLGLFTALGERLQGTEIGVFDAGTVIKGSPRDPIHFEPDSHAALGTSVAAWVAAELC